ncbi:oxidoreductase, short chain dehydrogenase/reductase family protein [Leptospira santarosai str. CBC1416]|uniref:Oxidoreductase, short chain dehydrogenase/reductase family protein n=4 Tax=Leptospira santarosai TaxID=28183 RepID=M6UNV5_9LEPT|nr:Oxidoreductase, short chain dehydrogenase/reductase family protein [Leptospira santarosai]EKO34114.1 oxidoreductase, short chain dehydrogenase/reductase family protein [Leptospira santarosai str. MOR084]EKO76358.1 oxidoreductase, short chain dehydrogenase/reductase family protein [Leptospira sp. Fiocruz LV3954]EKR93642.1 oxidoreductase, short chain dehydrogenase/reductase family protein [Leptospira santarosai str. CBC379]EKT87459.1 3-ketoacyl-ACP reductase [Leptospira santarosai serovar Sher
MLSSKNQKTNKKRNVILTGGSGGLGRAVVESLIFEGYSVTNLDIQAPKEISSGEFFLNTDLTKDEELIASLSEWENLISTQNQIPYGFVHCAGYGGPYHKITQVSPEEWDRIYSINIRSSFQIVKFLLPKFEKLQLGRLVFIASSLSLIGSANSVAYSSSKHALIGFVKSLADEWGSFGITTNAISPGYMETSMGIREDQVSNHRQKIIGMTPSGRIAHPSEIARVVSFLLNENSSYINGANWAVDGGITAI